jgi:phosphohistidine phosphatase SixA
MALTIPTYLVRHGEYNRDGGSLTKLGQEQARGSAQDLVTAGLGRSSLILSSNETRAMEHARIISSVLGCNEPLDSAQLARYGNYPELLRKLTLGELLLQELDSHKLHPDEIGSLVVVTHGPLIATAIGKPETTSTQLDTVVPLGGVFRYEPGSFGAPR